jgi:4-hydroxy-tetrahydrodipicolinate synthase
LITGSIVAMVTPMHADGNVDGDALKNLVEFHVDNGTNAIVAVGTTGESATLEHDEHIDVIRAVVRAVRGRLPVIGGSGANSTSEALSLTQRAKEAGVDACLLVTPYYNKPTQEGLFQHFERIAETVAIPQILYNVPGRTACDMLADTVVRLAALDNVVGIKEATGEIDRIHELKRRVSDDFAIYSGEDGLCMETMLAGGRGVISVTANVAPGTMRAMCDRALAGDRAGALELDNRLQALHKGLFVESNPIPAKWALEQMGLIGPGIRLPLTPLSASCHSVVLDAMHVIDTVAA